MASLEEVFRRLQVSRKEQKDIKTIYRDALANSKSYQDAVAQLTELRQKKKQLEADIKSAYQDEISKLETLALDIKTDREMLSDLALTQLMRGETVKVADEYENEYTPIFSVRFKKLG